MEGIDRARPTPSGPAWRLIDPDDPAVVAAVGTGLVALDLDDGEVRWRRDLSDVVDAGCETCLSVVDGRVVAFSTDATLAAFDPADGTPAWTHRLQSARGQVHPVGTRLVVTDQAPEPGSPARLDVLEAATGHGGPPDHPQLPQPGLRPRQHRQDRPGARRPGRGRARDRGRRGRVRDLRDLHHPLVDRVGRAGLVASNGTTWAASSSPS